MKVNDPERSKENTEQTGDNERMTQSLNKNVGGTYCCKYPTYISTFFFFLSSCVVRPFKILSPISSLAKLVVSKLEFLS